MTQISILGCGWLGLPLAKVLLENGFSIKGSTTSVEKLSMLENLGIKAFQIELSETKIQGEINSFLENSMILIIDIPPKLRGNSQESFVGKIEKLIPFIEKSTVENVIFISSTSVYGDSSSAPTLTEESELNPDTESGKQLVKSEQLLQGNSFFETIVLRFGGLIGEDRHPIKFLAGKTHIENPNAPINLIHQEDCIGIITAILCHNEQVEVWNETFNAVAPFHPSRKDYYTQKAIDLNLILPEFNVGNSRLGKTISSSKVKKVLEYKFVKPKL